MHTDSVLVLATANQAKVAELRNLLAGQPVTIKSLADFGPLPAIEEDGASFEENAYKKASMTARMLGLPCLADDSGLCVDALGGRPGVHSARYGGPGLDDAGRCRKLLAELGDTADRHAAFHCVISIAVPTGQALTYEATCRGRIAREPAGDNGFGYDPIFYYPPLGKTFAQLSMEEKQAVSHRGLALAQVKEEFDKILVWIRRHMPVPPAAGCMART